MLPFLIPLLAAAGSAAPALAAAAPAAGAAGAGAAGIGAGLAGGAGAAGLAGAAAPVAGAIGAGAPQLGALAQLAQMGQAIGSTPVSTIGAGGPFASTQSLGGALGQGAAAAADPNAAPFTAPGAAGAGGLLGWLQGAEGVVNQNLPMIAQMLFGASEAAAPESAVGRFSSQVGTPLAQGFASQRGLESQAIAADAAINPAAADTTANPTAPAKTKPTQLGQVGAGSPQNIGAALSNPQVGATNFPFPKAPRR